MSIPNELILEILQYLNNANLKRVRLVSKLWSGCASEYLFAKLYISSHELDVQIFTAVARDPMLSRCVKEVEYDAIHFTPHLTRSDYFDILQQESSKVASTNSVFKNSDPQICRFVTILRDLKKYNHLWQRRKADAQAQCRDFAFIQDGYRKWMEQAAFEKRYSEEPVFLKSLIFGMKQLSRLQTVRLRDEWPSDGKLRGEGSPLARSWHPFHAHPVGWLLDSGERLEQSRASEDFWTLASALSKAGKTGIRKLSFETIMTPTLFASGPGEKQYHVDFGVDAYRRIEELKLSFAGIPQETAVDVCYNRLQRMLESMTALKRFELELSDDFDSDPQKFFSYAMVFPKNGHWPQMTAFALRNLAIGAKDLTTLFASKMPGLRYLTLGSINLLNGQWEGIIEYLRVSDRLISFDIASESLLLHREDQDYLIDLPEAYRSSGFSSSYLEFSSSVEEYVVNWRHNPTLRHPSLMPDQPAKSSLDYLHDVYRLCGIEATGDTLDELVRHMEVEVARFTDDERTGRE